MQAQRFSSARSWRGGRRGRVAIPVGSAFGSGTLIGAGSTLVAPLVQQLGPDFKQRAGITVNYGSRRLRRRHRGDHGPHASTSAPPTRR